MPVGASAVSSLGEATPCLQKVGFSVSISPISLFWLSLVSVATHGLFSSYGGGGGEDLLSSCGVQASRGGGLSRGRAQALGVTVSGVQAPWLGHMDPLAPTACGTFPDQSSKLCLLRGQADS